MKARWQKCPEQWAQSEYLLERYKAAASLDIVAAAAGISATSLSRRLRELNPDYVLSSRRFAEPRRRAFLHYLKCHSLRQAAKLAGVNHATLWHWFRAMHPEYSAIARSGVFASSSDWLNSRKAQRQPNQAAGVEKWILDNLPQLIESEAASTLESHGLQHERSVQRRELPLIESQI